MEIIIHDKVFTDEQLNQWKLKRLKKAYKALKIKMPKNKSVKELEEDIAAIKFNMSYEEKISKLKAKLFFGNVGMKVVKFFSGKKRSQAITTIYAENITVEHFSQKLDDLMMHSTDINRKVNISANPEHYVLNTTNGIMEVIETTGNAPVPTQFFITFDDETDLKEQRNLYYSHQSVGTARLKNQTIIGGVRHQFRNNDQGNGIEGRFLVEFPLLCPKWIVKAHEKHLAVEWSNWIEWIRNN